MWKPTLSVKQNNFHRTKLLYVQECEVYLKMKSLAFYYDVIELFRVWNEAETQTYIKETKSYPE